MIVTSHELNHQSPIESQGIQQRRSSPVSKEYLRLFQAETFKSGKRTEHRRRGQERTQEYRIGNNRTEQSRIENHRKKQNSTEQRRIEQER